MASTTRVCPGTITAAESPLSRCAVRSSVMTCCSWDASVESNTAVLGWAPFEELSSPTTTQNNIPTIMNNFLISMGTNSTSTNLFTALAAGTAANVFKYGSDGTKADTDTWANVGSSDVSIFIDFSAGTSGEGYVTVEYIQNNNNTI